MNQVDKISREALTLLQYAKDTSVANITVANSTGKLEPQLSPAQIHAVINLLELSLLQGYQRALPTFQRVVKDQLAIGATNKQLENSKKK